MSAQIRVDGDLEIAYPIDEEIRYFIDHLVVNNTKIFKIQDPHHIAFHQSDFEGLNPVEDYIKAPIDSLCQFLADYYNHPKLDGKFIISSDSPEYNGGIVSITSKMYAGDKFVQCYSIYNRTPALMNATTNNLIKELETRGVLQPGLQFSKEFLVEVGAFDDYDEDYDDIEP